MVSYILRSCKYTSLGDITFALAAVIIFFFVLQMSLPAVKKFIYQYSRKCGSPEVEGRLNIMYAAYAVIHLNSSVDELLKAQTLFNSLLRAHFSLEDLKVGSW